MKHILAISAIAVMALLTSCGSARSGASGITAKEVVTYTQSINDYDLNVDPEGITYTIDISTPEGKLKLHGLNLEQAQNQVLQEAAIKNNCAMIVSPKFSYLKEGKDILRITVFGFPARYKNKQNTTTTTHSVGGKIITNTSR